MVDNVKFEKLNFVVTEDKKLFYKDKECLRLNRHLFSILEDNDCFYLLDRVGDCYTIEKSILEKINFINKDEELKIQLKFLFGIISLPTEFQINDKELKIRDSYNRKFIYSKKGLLLRMDFN